MAAADVWHSGGNNVTENTTRLVVEAAYGARRVSQKFWSVVGLLVQFDAS